MPNDRLRIYLPIILALAIIAGIFIGYKLSSSPLKSTRSSNKYEADKISNILNFIKDYYVDTVNFKKLSENAINDILQNLDPHSYYIPASELAEANEPLAGNFDGIGVEFNIRRDTIVVVSTISGGPSEKVGIRPGDRIIKVENRNVAGIHITNNQVMKMLRGKRGTKVLLTVLHSTQNRFVNFTIIRDKIPTFSVDAAYMMEDKIGYIKIDKFSATTFDEYTKALAKLKKQGLRKLILDLRGNGGGYLDAAVMLSNDLLSKDKLIVYTQGRVRPKNEIYAPGNGNFTTQPLVVLIDEWS
ncbi:MAG: S41 family peptidase, partial [Bacteroidota bacterium]|nr:S41 family peptidase [Bacteroidota bacterium]